MSNEQQAKRSASFLVRNGKCFLENYIIWTVTKDSQSPMLTMTEDKLWLRNNLV